MDQNFQAFHEFVHQPQNKEVQEVFQSIIHEVSSIFDWKIKIALVKYRQQNGMNRHLPGQLVRAQNRLLNCKFTENAYDPANDNLFRLSPSPFKSFSFRDDTDKPVTLHWNPLCFSPSHSPPLQSRVVAVRYKCINYTNTQFYFIHLC